MIYTYDILLNLKKFEDSCEFYEWCDSDEVEHIKKIPLFKVSKTMIEDLFTKQWITNTSVETDENGIAKFKGFYGKYDAAVELDGKTITKEINFTKKSGKRFEIII